MKLYSACLAFLFLLLAVLGCNLSENRNASNQNASKADGDVRVLGTFTNRRNIVNKYVLVEKGVSNDKLVELAKKLHSSEPEVNFWFVDDDSKADEMLKWVKAYEKGEAAATDPIFDWMGEHIVANLQQYFGPGGTKYWALAKGMMGDQISKIE